MSEISQERMESAMTFLAESDAQFGQDKADLERTEILRKRSRASVFLTVDGTVAERQAKAELDADVQTADDNYIDAVKRYETLRARRERAQIVIDVWRSLNASRRKV